MKFGENIKELDSDDIFADYRNRMRYKFDAFISVLILPFIVLAIHKANYVILLLLVLLLAQVATNFFSYIYKREYVFPILTTFGSCIVLMVYGMIFYTPAISHWTYPFILTAFFFSSSSNSKYIVSAYVTALIVTAIFFFEDQGMAIRYSASLLILCVFTTLLMNVIHQQQTKMTFLAIRDPLTNAYNRHHMDETLNIAIERMKRQNSTASLIYLDIDFFKNINDQHGHDVGDRILIRLVELIKERLRKTDMLFRLGGEEFIILLDGAELQPALAFANEVRIQVENYNFHNDIKVTVSMGVKEYEADLTIEDWIKKADELLYQAKESGRNRVES